MFQILSPDGTLNGEAPIGIERTQELYEALVYARAYDRKCTSLQKQGRLATYAPFEGQEAAQIGSAAALRPDDWMVATYRDGAAMWLHGYPMSLLILGRTGDERGGHPPEDVHVLPASITVGAHMLHAVGLSWGERLAGTDRIAITYFGDGATSEGDFHEAMNFAGVYRIGTVFVCQNNQYAISMARGHQTASETISQKADAYGMPGVQVDGNDLFAMYQVTSDAVTRARATEGGTLIEAFTYRIGPHTTSDDPTRYRDDDEPEHWKRRDPLDRVRRYLGAHDAWDEDWESQLREAASEDIEAAVQEAEDIAPQDPDEIFAGVFADLTPPLREQAAELGA